MRRLLGFFFAAGNLTLVLELLELTEAPRPPVASLAELFRRAIRSDARLA